MSAAPPVTGDWAGGPHPTSALRAHVDALARPLADLRRQADTVDRWGRHLADVLLGGGRLLAAGNGGSAAQAAHLTSELVGRFRDERAPLSALALGADVPALTAVANDYGYDEVFARQVRAHGRPGDVAVLLSTSGRSPNIVAAARAARDLGLSVWALTGGAPNPLVDVAHDSVAVEAVTATVQEVHQVVVHLLCLAVDAALVAHAPRDAS